MNRLHEQTSTISVRITSELKNQIDILAEAVGRTRSFIVEEALKRYVKEESWQVEATRSALQKADSDDARFGDNVLVKEWLKSWGTDIEKNPPKCK